MFLLGIEALATASWYLLNLETDIFFIPRIRDVQVSLCLYGIFSFITIGFDEMFPIFADSSKVYGMQFCYSDCVNCYFLIPNA